MRYIAAIGGANSGTSVFFMRLNTSTDKMEFLVGGVAFVSSVSTATLTIGADYVFSGIYDGSAATLYVNDSAQTPGAKTGNSGLSNVYYSVGDNAYQTTPTWRNSYWAGSIAAISVYNIALSVPQNTAVYTAMAAL